METNIIIFEDFERKISDSSYFLYSGDRIELNQGRNQTTLIFDEIFITYVTINAPLQTEM